MVIDGQFLAEQILDSIKQEAAQLETGLIPTLAVITVGEEVSWQTYVRQKQKRAEELGFLVNIINLQGVPEQEIIAVIQNLNKNDRTHGIIVQRPVPKHLDINKIIQAIDPAKDVDGFRNDSIYIPPVWLTIKDILEYVFSHFNTQARFEDWLKEQSIVVLGKGETAGQPALQGLQQMGITPTVIDRKTQNPDDILKNADVIISGVGKPILHSENTKKGTILIGIGIHKEQKKLKGDYDANEIAPHVSYYTPTPGGVGPLNLAYLMKNLLQATIDQQFHVNG